MNFDLIDTHVHLYFADYETDLAEVIRRAGDAGVTKMITIGVDVQTSIQCVQLAENYPQLYAAVGIHPNDAAAMQNGDLIKIDHLLSHPKVVAIGEIGMDFHHQQTPPEQQMAVFRRFLEWSLDRNLPIVLHTRQAEEKVIACLHQLSPNGWQGVFHCFGGDAQQAEQAMAMGFHLSFTGNITYKNSHTFAVMKSVPLERLLLETDSPLMPPVPYRGQRNEPAYVRKIAEKIAEGKNLTLETVARQTTLNAMALFNLAG